MNIKLRADFSKIILAMLIFFFPMIVFWIGGRPIYVWLELLFVVVCILKYKKYYAIKYIAINLMLLTRFLSAISAQTGNLPAYLHKSAIVQTVYALIAYLAVSYVYHAIEWKTFDTLSTIIKAFKLMVMVELFWIPLQFICYYAFSTDINKLLFVDTFHMVENASFVRSWVWYPSGLSWHSALLAPMFVIGLLIFDNLWVRVFIVADALICGNSTTLIGVILTLLLLFFPSLGEKKKIKTRTIFIGGIVLIAGIFIAYRLGMYEKMQSQFSYTFERLFTESGDESTAAHLKYFSDYFEIAKESSITQILFGYGEGCSGYPIWMLNGRDTVQQSWSVECDFVDLLISRGIFGFVAFYYFMLYIAVKGFKIDKLYTIAIIVIMIEGIGYNVQWAYVFFIELILFACVKAKISFFNLNV